MSLIHQALEKADQEKRDSPSPLTLLSETKEKARARENLRVIYGMVLALVFCLILGGIYLFVGSGPREKLAKVPTLTLPSPSQGRFTLTGITRVGNEGTAIINNELVRVGDQVSGARVIHIGEEEVSLDLRGQTITLALYGQETAHLTRLEKTE